MTDVAKRTVFIGMLLLRVAETQLNKKYQLWGFVFQLPLACMF